MRHFLTLLIVLTLLEISLIASNAKEPAQKGGTVADEITPTQKKFFEENVHPILARRCFECHGVETQENGLRLDSRQAILLGGDSGKKAAVPGEPEKSQIIQAILHQDGMEMPPEEKLPANEIEILVKWVKSGLPWPKSSNSVASPLTMEDQIKQARKIHWAYQKIARPQSPTVKQTAWSRTPIDLYVMAALEEAGLTPSDEVDRRTLIRRASFDLLGLPPTPEEVEAFIADQAPNAYEQLVERLLASPHYGERWGRHWLDVARYADTRGYAFGRERRFPYAYTYRDYVINALNRDLPYDQFLVEQLAADRLGLSEDNEALAALGFMTVGRKFNNRHDDLDDQIDVVGRGLLGLTVGCARCHDHKYDAIPIEDYYSLYGVFASSTEPSDLPLIGDPSMAPGYDDFKKELDKRRQALEELTKKKHAALLDVSRKNSTDYLVRVVSKQPEELLQKLPFISLSREDLKPPLVRRWQVYLNQNPKTDHPLWGVWGAWKELIELPEEDFSQNAQQVLAKRLESPADPNVIAVNPLVKAALSEKTLDSKIDVARAYGEMFTKVYQQWREAGGDASAMEKLSEESRQVATALLGPKSPTDIPLSELGRYLTRKDNNERRNLERLIQQHQVDSPGSPPRAMVLFENSRPHNPRVFIRGNHARPGKPVPRRFLQVVSGSNKKPFVEGSGRLELARSIASLENPLTRRVIANRVWMHHFGQPLVSTPSDFGQRTSEPTPKGLLDYLAAQLGDKGWSLKELHREIMTSSVYRQASLDRPACSKVDPENQHYWRANRQRLEFEAMRDSLLAVSGRLDETMGGKPVNIFKNKASGRRTVYGFIDRQDLPGLLRVFDFASPDQSTARRSQTSVPQQSLYLMNSPATIELSKELAAREELAGLEDPAEHISALYRLIFTRMPEKDELEVGLQFINSAGKNSSKEVKLSAWEQYAQMLLLTNEFIFID